MTLLLVAGALLVFVVAAWIVMSTRDEPAAEGEGAVVAFVRAAGAGRRDELDKAHRALLARGSAGLRPLLEGARSSEPALMTPEVRVAIEALVRDFGPSGIAAFGQVLELVDRVHPAVLGLTFSAARTGPSALGALPRSALDVRVLAASRMVWDEPELTPEDPTVALVVASEMIGRGARVPTDLLPFAAALPAPERRETLERLAAEAPEVDLALDAALAGHTSTSPHSWDVRALLDPAVRDRPEAVALGWRAAAEPSPGTTRWLRWAAEHAEETRVREALRTAAAGGAEQDFALAVLAKADARAATDAMRERRRRGWGDTDTSWLRVALHLGGPDLHRAVVDMFPSLASAAEVGQALCALDPAVDPGRWLEVFARCEAAGRGVVQACMRVRMGAVTEPLLTAIAEPGQRARSAVELAGRLRLTVAVPAVCASAARGEVDARLARWALELIGQPFDPPVELRAVLADCASAIAARAALDAEPLSRAGDGTAGARAE